MRESTNSSRSWRVRLDFLARLRNKVNKKVDEFFVNLYYGDQAEQQAPPPPPPPTPAGAQAGQPWSTPHGHFDYTEASGSNHSSTQNSQYFNPANAPEYLQQHQIPRFEFPGEFSQVNVQGRSSSQPGMDPPASAFHQDLLFDQDMPIDHHLSTPHDQSFLRDFDHQHQQVPVNEYNTLFPDAVTEIERNDPMSSWQATISYSQGHGAPSSIQMSGDTDMTEDSNIMDTGDSNVTYILPPQPVHQRRTVIRNILTFEDVRRILLDEEAESRLPGRRGFRVIASIVYAYRKLRNLVRRKRMQRIPTTPCSMSGELEGSGSGKLKRIRSADCSRVYQGIKQRKGKWVAEIRVSKMPDKVWLGSFPLEKQAALAYDAGLHHCSMKRNKIFNFKESPQKLGPSQYLNLCAMSKEDRKTKVQSLASDYAMAYGSSNNIR